MKFQREIAEQTALFAWASLESLNTPELRLLFHVPNGDLRHPVVGRRLKEIGVKPGVPDVFLPVPRGGFHGLWIELKSPRGRVSAPQKRWLAALEEQGYRVVVCRSWEEAKKEITAYLGAKKPAAIIQGDEKTGRYNPGGGVK